MKKGILGGKRETFETRRRHKDGRLVDVSIIGTTVGIRGDHYGVYAIYRDITLKKRQEEELRRAKEAAESADRLKSAFLASMSHRAAHATQLHYRVYRHPVAAAPRAVER